MAKRVFRDGKQKRPKQTARFERDTYDPLADDETDEPIESRKPLRVKIESPVAPPCAVWDDDSYEPLYERADRRDKVNYGDSVRIEVDRSDGRGWQQYGVMHRVSGGWSSPDGVPTVSPGPVYWVDHMSRLMQSIGWRWRTTME